MTREHNRPTLECQENAQVGRRKKKKSCRLRCLNSVTESFFNLLRYSHPNTTQSTKIAYSRITHSHKTVHSPIHELDPFACKCLPENVPVTFWCCLTMREISRYLPNREELKKKKKKKGVSFCFTSFDVRSASHARFDSKQTTRDTHGFSLTGSLPGHTDVSSATPVLVQSLKVISLSVCLSILKKKYILWCVCLLFVCGAYIFL